jgi:hypothetical protein
VLGVDLGAFAQRAMNGRAEVVSRSYVNAYEPSLDVLFRWVRDRYVAGEPMPWLISTAPAGKQVSILLSHDVDAGTSPANSVTYSQALKARGLSATFFVQTKYMRDYNDVAFFNDAAAAATGRLVSSGMDVGSHTVAHSREFESMPLGDGRERYPAYRHRGRAAAEAGGPARRRRPAGRPDRPRPGRRDDPDPPQCHRSQARL